jgi:outer membrane protein insertion porin family
MTRGKEGIRGRPQAWPAPRGAGRRLLLLLPALLAMPASPAAAQAPLFLVNGETTVASVDFQFPEGRSLSVSWLQDQISLAGPTLGQRIRGILDVLPLISPPRYEPFSPPELLRDVIRLERFYQNEGFQDPRVEYSVTLDTVPNAVEVVFVVREGRPILLDTVEILDESGLPLEESLPSDLQNLWPRLLRRLEVHRGERLSSSLRVQIQDRAANWLRDNGYPFPAVAAETRVEDGGGRLILSVRPGNRARVGELGVDGNVRLSDPVLLREVPLGRGDWYSQSRLGEGQRRILGLDMVRLATTRTEVDSEADSLVNLRIQVDEGKLRLLTGGLGFTSESGLSGDASWGHRDFFGGARTLEISGAARTGWLAPEAGRTERYGLSVLLRQPHFLDRRLAASLRPFGEYRDDVRDRSAEAGGEVSVLYQRGSERRVTLRYALTHRWVLDARPGGGIGEEEDLEEFLRGLEALRLDRLTSSLSLTARWGRALDARRGIPGWSVLGSGEVAGPRSLSTVQYGKVVWEGSAAFPLDRGLVLSARAGFGRLFPYGVSIPAPDGSDRLEIYLRLRDATLTAGGAHDVRGWGSELLGPKVPDLRMGRTEGSLLRAGSYLPLGGLARWTASGQLEFPLPFVGRPHGSHIFLDGGRVWTPDARFQLSDAPLIPGQLGEGVRFGTGAGVVVATPVGPVQLDLGYKVNPSLLDLRDPKRVARALSEGESVESVPETPLRRWHLHLSIGRIR